MIFDEKCTETQQIAHLQKQLHHLPIQKSEERCPDLVNTRLQRVQPQNFTNFSPVTDASSRNLLPAKIKDNLGQNQNATPPYSPLN